MNGFYVDNNGKTANYPRYYRKEESILHKLSRLVSRKKKGSNNRYKARIKLAKWHEHTSNMRSDFLHKLSHQIAEQFDVVAVEELDMHGMAQALNFGKSVSDNG